MIRFIVPGVSVGKGRPRVGRVAGHARLFTPAKTVNYEGLVAHCAHEAMGGAPLLDEAVMVRVGIYCPVPASWSAKKRDAALCGRIRPTTKPDIDNCIKALFDGMNGVVWRDDVLAVEVSVAKQYDLSPRVVVEVTPAI